MSSSRLNLTAFLNRLDTFINEMIETYPEQAKRLRTAQRAYSLMRDNNPALVCRMFRKHVVAAYEVQIMSKDETFIKVGVETQLKTDFPEFYDMFQPCVAIWDTMTDTSKDALWKHLQVLLVLCKRVDSV